MAEFMPYIQCDECGTQTDDGVESLDEARDFAQHEGWVLSGADPNGKDLCPDCAPEE